MRRSSASGVFSRSYNNISRGRDAHVPGVSGVFSRSYNNPYQTV